jgi:hypothetical protein
MALSQCDWGIPLDDMISDISNGWVVAYDDLNTVGYDIDVNEKTLTLNHFGMGFDSVMSSHYFRPQMQLSIIEATRMIRHIEWLDGALGDYHPESIIQIGRICVADALAHQILSTSTNDDNGDAPWKHLLCGDISDIAMAFENGLESYLTRNMDYNIALKKSMAMAFNTWFSNQDRLKACDHDTLDLIDEMSDNQDFNDGQKLQTNDIVCLTSMRGTQSTYIDKTLCDDVIHNPYYKAIDDPINQSHFMQIIHDMHATRVGALVFQDSDLAARFS